MRKRAEVKAGKETKTTTPAPSRVPVFSRLVISGEKPPRSGKLFSLFSALFLWGETAILPIHEKYLLTVGV